MLDLGIKSHRPLREIVYTELKMQILQGIIAPGTRLMEVEMAEQMGVSRTPIREAIHKLEKEGLVVIEPRRGAYVSQVSMSDMLEILELRENLEGFAAYRAALYMTLEEKQELRRVEQLYNKAVEEGCTVDLIKFDTDFHLLIVKGSKNKILVNVIDQLYELVLRFRYLYYDSFEKYIKVPDQHKAIVEAIFAGDPEGAREASNQHMADIIALTKMSEARKQDNTSEAEA